MTIKVNGMTISVENTNSVNMDMDIEKEVESIESMSNNINKSIEALNIISNIKAVESFGYKSTEAVGESIKNGIKNIGRSIADFIDKLITTITDFIRKKVIETKINLAEKKLKALKDKGATEVVIYPEKWNAFETKLNNARSSFEHDLAIFSEDYLLKKQLSEIKGVFMHFSFNIPSGISAAMNSKYESANVSIDTVETAVADIKRRVSDVLYIINLIRTNAVAIKKDVRQLLNKKDKEKDTISVNLFINACGKTFAAITSYVAAVTTFNSSKPSK